MHTERPRMAVLGLDGLPYPLAQWLCRQGVTPNLARLILSDKAGPLRAELPELSPVNWTSFYTAAGPGEHGVFGFTQINPATYEISLADSSRVACPTIFDRLGQAGLTSKVVNLPNTYPAKPLRGMLVAGFPAAELSRAVHPPMLAAMLARNGYRLEADTEHGSLDHDLLLSELNRMLDARRSALDLLWPDLAWDLFVFVITETDRLFHFLFDALEESAHPLHGHCLAFMARLDGLAGEFIERFDALPGPKRLMVLADHGFTRLRTELDVNSLLMREGYLSLDAAPASGLDMRPVSASSRALALDPGRIYLHTRERFARGALSAFEAESVSRDISALLENLTWDGRKVIRRVHRAEELYQGPCLPMAPDLVIEPEPGVNLTAKLDGREIFGLHHRSGTHTVADALFYDSDGYKPERMRDTGARVLDFFGLGGHNAGSTCEPDTTIITIR